MKQDKIFQRTIKRAIKKIRSKLSGEVDQRNLVILSTALLFIVGLLIADRRLKTITSQASKPVPPQLATFLLCLFLSADDRDNIIGDLDEKFPKRVERHGVRMARFLYLKDACTTIYPAAQKL